MVGDPDVENDGDEHKAAAADDAPQEIGHSNPAESGNVAAKPSKFSRLPTKEWCRSETEDAGQVGLERRGFISGQSDMHEA